MSSHKPAVNRTILRLALPSVLMNISVPLLGAVDTAVVGHLPAVYYVGAVGIGTMLFNILYWAFSFFRMSTVGLAAQSYGRKDMQECVDVLGRGLLLGFVVGLAVILLRELYLWVAFLLIDASPEVTQHARIYFRIRVFAAPAVLMGQVFTGWFFGIQNVAIPVALTIGINLLNVALDFLFVVGFGLNSDGVAWATLISQYAGLGAMLILFWWKYRGYWVRFSLARLLEREKLMAILHSNSDIFLRTVSNLFASSLFMARSAALGDLILATNTILLQFRFIAMFALDGFAAAAEVTVGAATGRGDRPELFQAIRLSLCWGLFLGGAFSAVYFFFSPWLIVLFTNQPEVSALVAVFMIWLVAELWISNFCYTLDGVFVGLMATKTMRNTMIFSVFFIFLPVFLLLEHLFGNHGMWAASLFLFLSRSATLAWYLLRYRRDPQYRLP